MMENTILTVDVRKGNAVRVTFKVQNKVAQTIAHHSNLTISLYLIIEVVKLKNQNCSRNVQTIVLTVLYQATILDFQLGPD